jgi:DNA-binding transcriptional LysR family regulator
MQQHFKAANKLYISQQGLSIIISKLEQELGVLLFYRSSSKLQLTEYGEFLLERAKVLIKSHDLIKNDLNILKERKSGEIKIGLPYGVGVLLPHDLIENFVRQYPNVVLRFLDFPDKVCEDEVLNERIDIGFCVAPIDQNKFNIHSTHRHETAFMISEKNPLSQKTHINFEELINETYIGFGKDTKGHDIFMQKCLKHGFEPKNNLTVTGMEVIYKLCRNNAGIGFYVGPVGAALPRLEGIKIVKALNEDWFFDVCIVTKKNTYLNEVMHTFLHYIAQW